MGLTFLLFGSTMLSKSMLVRIFCNYLLPFLMPWLPPPTYCVKEICFQIHPSRHVVKQTPFSQIVKFTMKNYLVVIFLFVISRTIRAGSEAEVKFALSKACPITNVDELKSCAQKNCTTIGYVPVFVNPENKAVIGSDSAEYEVGSFLTDATADNKTITIPIVFFINDRTAIKEFNSLVKTKHGNWTHVQADVFKGYNEADELTIRPEDLTADGINWPENVTLVVGFTVGTDAPNCSYSNATLDEVKAFAAKVGHKPLGIVLDAVQVSKTPWVMDYLKDFCTFFIKTHPESKARDVDYLKLMSHLDDFIVDEKKAYLLLSDDSYKKLLIEKNKVPPARDVSEETTVEVTTTTAAATTMATTKTKKPKIVADNGCPRIPKTSAFSLIALAFTTLMRM